MTTSPPRIGTRIASAFNDNTISSSSVSRTLNNSYQQQHKTSVVVDKSNVFDHKLLD